MIPKGQSLVWGFLVMLLLGGGNVWGKTNFQNLLGLHAGYTTGGGLFYRHYVGKNFAWQVSFFPSYQQVPSYFSSEESKLLFLWVGTMEQWFLHFTQLNTTAMKGMLFVWGGGSFAYQYTSMPYVLENKREIYRVSLGGGPGFEVVFYDHFVVTVAGGYAAAVDMPGGFMMNFTIEASFGYKF